MKSKFICSLLILGASTSYLQAQTKKTNNTPNKASAVQEFSLKTPNDSLSYALGIDVASNLKEAGFQITNDVFYKGMIAALKNEKLMLDDNQKQSIIQSEFRKAYEQKNAALKKVGEDFLAKNKTRPEIKVTPEGVQYEVLKEGDGPQANADSEVEVHYKGTLIDGTQFDSSYDRNESLTLDLNRVIEGWKIGISLMKVGSKYKFYIPYNLAYGERATGSIPAFSALIFEVELLGIKAE